MQDAFAFYEAFHGANRFLAADHKTLAGDCLIRYGSLSVLNSSSSDDF